MNDFIFEMYEKGMLDNSLRCHWVGGVVQKKYFRDMWDSEQINYLHQGR